MTHYVYWLPVVLLAVLYAGTLVWAYRDALARRSNAVLVTMLVALGVWPYGLVLWAAVRPELPSAKKETSSKKSAVGTGLGKYMSDVKEMPLLLLLFFLMSVYSLVNTTSDLFLMKPVVFEYFNSGFPRNAPVVWHLYMLAFSVTTIVVYLKRSYSALQSYLFVSLGVLIFAVLNSVYFVVNLPADKRVMSIALYVFTYVCALLSLGYQLNQRRYFNRE